MEPSMITMIINIVLAVFILWGFLWGLGRGLTKSTIRLFYFLGFVIVFAIISPYISQALLGIEIPQLNGNIQEYLQAQILTDPTVQDLYDGNPAIQDLIIKLPAVIVNLVLFLVLVILAKFFSWIGYCITCKIHLKKPKKNKNNQPNYTIINGQAVPIQEPPQPKKYRFFGGLVGAFMGLTIMFCLFLPITGTIGVALQYINTSAIAAEQSSNTKNAEFEYNEISNYILDNLDDETLSYIKAYQNSIMNKIFSVGNVNLKCYDLITTTTINGEKVVIRKEFNTVANIIEASLYVEKFTRADNDLKFKDIDFNKINKAISDLFDSGLVKSVGLGLLEYYLDCAEAKDDRYVDVEPTPENPHPAKRLDTTNAEIDKAIDELGGDDVRSVIKAINDNFKAGQFSETLKGDFLAIIGIFQALCESGAMDIIVEEAPTYENKTPAEIEELEKERTEKLPMDIIKALRATDENTKKTYLNNAFTSLLSSTTLRTALTAGANVGIKEVKNQIAQLIADEDTEYKNATTETAKNTRLDTIKDTIVIDNLVENKIKWSDIADKITSICDKVIDLYDFYTFKDATTNNKEFFENFDIESSADLKKLFTMDGFKTSLDKIGELLNAFTNLEIFKGTENGTSILPQLYTQLNKIPVSFVDGKTNPLKYYYDLTELNNYDWKLNFTNILYDISQIAIDPLSADSLEEFDWKTLKYNDITASGKTTKGIISIFDDLFSTQSAKAMQTSVLAEIASEMEDGPAKDLITDLTNVLVSTSATETFSIYDKKDELLNYIKGICVLGESGLVDFIVKVSDEEIESAELKTEISTFITELENIKQGQTKTQLDRFIDYIIDSNLTKQMIISGMNYFILPEIEGSNDLGRIEKTYSWTGWETSQENIKIVFNNLIDIYKNIGMPVDFEEYANVNEILDMIINDKFATADTGTCALLGEILDIFANSKLLEYDKTPTNLTDNSVGNIFDNILDTVVSSYIYTDVAVESNDPEFWQKELQRIANAIEVLNNTEYDEFNSLLIALLAQEDNAFDKLSEISDSNLNIISEALINSSIIKNYSVLIFNSINEILINIVDEDAVVEDVCDLDTDFTAQQTSLKNLILKAKKCFNITDITVALQGEQKDDVIALLDALEENANYATGKQGLFYTAYNDYYKQYHDLITVLNSEFLTGSTTITLLDAVLDGTDITNEVKNLSSADLEIVINALCDCELLKSYAVDVFNNINSELINVIDSTYTGAVCDSSTDLKSQKADILNVVKKIIDCMSIEGELSDIFTTALEGEQKDSVIALLNELEINANKTGLFYTAYYDYYKPYDELITVLNREHLSDSPTVTLLDAVLDGTDITNEVKELSTNDLETVINSLCDCELLDSYAVDIFNNINTELIKVVDSTYTGTICSTSTDFKSQKTTILNVVKKGIACMNFDGELSNILSTNKTDIQNLLVALNTSAIQNGIFKTASDKYTAEFEEIINEFNNSLAKTVVSTYSGSIDLSTAELITQFNDIADTLVLVKDLPETLTLETLFTDNQNLTIDLLSNLQGMYNYDDEAVFAQVYINFATPIQNGASDNSDVDLICDYIDLHNDSSADPDYVGNNIGNYDWTKIILGVDLEE